LKKTRKSPNVATRNLYKVSARPPPNMIVLSLQSEQGRYASTSMTRLKKHAMLKSKKTYFLTKVMTLAYSSMMVALLKKKVEAKKK